MPRNKRINLPGVLYHVIARGIERRKIFKDDKDREEFLSRFNKALSETGCRCYAWTLIPNHFHLLIRTGEYPLSHLMRKLLSGYAGYFNRRHRRVGHIFQNRYKSILCQEDKYLLELVRYIHLNPLRAKLITDIKQLEKYPWSGHSIICRKKKDEFQETGEVLSLFSDNIKQALAMYREFMVDGIKQGKRPELTGGGLKRSAGGWTGIKQLRGLKEYWRGDERILGEGGFVEETLKVFGEKLERREQLVRVGFDLEEIVKRICRYYSVEPGELVKRGRGNSLSSAKALISYFGNLGLGINQKELGRFLRISAPAVGKNVRLGEKIVKEEGIDILSL